jgi:hypothetical protein
MPDGGILSPQRHYCLYTIIANSPVKVNANKIVMFTKIYV